jgi:alpha-glucosidase
MKRCIIVSLSLCLFALSFSQTHRLSEQIGNVTSVSPIKSGFSITTTNATVAITSYNATTLRIRVTKGKPAADNSFAIDDLTPKGELRLSQTSSDQVTATTDSLTIKIQKKPFRISVLNKKGEELCTDEPSLGISWFGNEVTCYKKLHADEKFIGLGEKTGHINRRGMFYQNWNSDVPAYGLEADPLYSTLPFFIGTHDKVCYGIFFDNSCKSFFNFGGGANEEQFQFGATDGEMNYYIFGGATVNRVIQDYTNLTGRAPMPPQWSLGFQQSRWGYDNPDQLLSIAKTFRDKKLPADVIVCDINYMDHYKVFTWSNKFPDVKGMMDKMKAMQFDLVTIIDPGIKVEKGYKAYDEGVANNYFAKYPDGKPYTGNVWPGACHFPDFTKEATRKWWGDNFKSSHVDNGIRGFWNDMNEPAAWGKEIPDLIEFGEGKDKQTLYSVKNAYGLLMARSTFEGTKRLMHGERPFVLTRASYAGVQKYSAQWTGDNVSSDEHMLLGIRLINSMGATGVPYVGMDIGGFMGNPSPDLFVRWMSVSAFTPLFRNHAHIDCNSREPWLFGDANTEKIRKILEQRYQLMPYLYSSFYQTHITGIPVNRMLPIDYTYDTNVYDEGYENQFLFGDNLLVCPAASTQSALSVYLPGTKQWYRLHNDDEQYAGGHVYNVRAPLTDLPVFVKAGAIIPMQCVVQNTKEKGDGTLYLHVWKGESGSSFIYYEDDGETYQYEQNNFYKRTITYDPASNSLALSSKEGGYNSKFTRLQVILHGFGGTQVAACALQDGEMKVNLQ